MPVRRHQTAATLDVDVIDAGGDWSALDEAEDRIGRAAAAVACWPGLIAQPSSVAIALSSDAEVAALNGSYRGQPKATNVLSFPAGKGNPTGFLGDIILASETVAREAAEQSIPLEHHVTHLVVHGLLHLLGFDHETPAEAERMEKLEIEILSTLHIANPYNGDLLSARQPNNLE